MPEIALTNSSRTGSTRFPTRRAATPWCHPWRRTTPPQRSSCRCKAQQWSRTAEDRTACWSCSHSAGH